METIKIQEILKESWRKFKPQFFPLVGITIFFFIILLTLSLFFPVSLTTTDFSFTMLMSILKSNLISMLLSIIFMIGFIRISFDVLEDEDVSLKYFLPNIRTFFNLFIVNLIVSVVVSIGFLLLVVPGIYLGVRLAFASVSVVKHNMGIMESIKYSWHMTDGRFSKLFLFFLILFGLSLLGVIFFLIGQFFVFPFTILAVCLMYNILEKNTLDQSNADNLSTEEHL